MKRIAMFMFVFLCVFFTAASVFAKEDDSIKHFNDGTITIDFPEKYEVDVPKDWMRTDFEYLPDILFMYPLGDLSFVFGLSKVDCKNESDQEQNDALLKENAESALQEEIKNGSFESAKISELSNSERSAIVTVLNTDSDGPQFGVAVSKYCGNSIFTITMFGDLTHATNDDFYNDLDSILCSVKEKKDA